MTVHHIHPHVINHGGQSNHNDRNFNFKNHNDIFKNLDQIFHDHPGSTQHGHSFSATYSNQNGHVTRHFSRDGQSVNAGQAQKMMDQMNHQMQNMDKLFNNDLGLGNDFQSMGHNLDQMLGNHSHHHSNPIHRLMNHFKK